MSADIFNLFREVTTPPAAISKAEQESRDRHPSSTGRHRGDGDESLTALVAATYTPRHRALKLVDGAE